MLLIAAVARAQTVRSDLVITNGTVNAQVVSGGTLYIGGSFSAVGATTGAGVPVDSVSALAVPGLPQVLGQVNAVVADGAGGWYIGGAFTQVGVAARANLAHILPGGAVDAWDPSANGAVNALVMGAGVVYAGGAFTQVGGQPRNRLAALDGASGLATAWDPNANGTVGALALGAGAVYAGGAFTTVGGQPRNRVAALDAASGAVTAWNPNANSTVRALAAAGGTVYAGGDFLLIGGASRTRIAALDTLVGAATAWNPSANSSVMALAVTGGTVYAGGTFTFVGAQSRNRIAAIDAASGAATAWNPSANGQVLALAVAGSVVYAGGDFLAIGGQSRSRVAALDAASGLATPWDPTAYGTVSALAEGGGVVYVGGVFSGMGGTRRGNLAAIDLASGAVTAWNPVADGQVLALAAAGGRIYAGGAFSTLGGLGRSNLAAIDSLSGGATAWAPEPDGQVSALAVNGGTVYAGGVFSFIGGQSRSNLAALDATSGLAAPWSDGTDGQVFALALGGGRLLAGGNFAVVGGQSRTNLAAFDTTTGAVAGWSPQANGTVRGLLVDCATVYVAGFFTSIGGQSRNRVAALDVASGLATAWNPNASGPLFALVLGGSRLYAAGIFGTIGGQARNRIASLDPQTGAASAWDPNANGTVRTLALGAGGVYAGGSFTALGGLGQANLAGISIDASTTCPAIALAPPALPGAVVGAAYAQGVSASGGSGATCFALSAGRLPDGLTLDAASGLVHGTPTVAGGFAFALTATDAAGCTGTQTYALVVACPVVALAPDAMPDGTRGVAYAQTLTASGGTAPYAFALADGALPAGLTLSSAGVLAGTPLAQGAAAFTVRATDAHGCAGVRLYSLTIFNAGAPARVAADPTGLCLNPAHPCVTVPFTIVRSDSVAVRALSVSFQIDASRLALCTPGNPAASIRPGAWVAAFDNALTQVVDHGGGAFTVDQTLLGAPCGVTGGGQVFTVDLAAIGADGLAALTVTAVSLRDCDNLPLAAAPGAPESLLVRNAPLTVLPTALAAPIAGVPVADTLVCPDGAAPVAFAVSAGALPAGLALSAGGVLAGTPTASGPAAFSVTATDAHGSLGSRAYALTVGCPPIAVGPAVIPDGALGVTYDVTLTVAHGQAPFVWIVSAGTLPGGLALAGATGRLAGTPDTPGTSSFSVRAVDAYGCADSASYTVTVFPTLPQSTVAAVTQGVCVTTSRPCVSVPFVFARADSAPLRAIGVTFQLDVARLGLCTPGTPAASVHAGTWSTGFATPQLQVIDNGGGSYTVDQSLLGEPCGITGGGMLFSVDLKAVGEDGAGAVTVTAVKARDCVNQPIPARAGAPALLAVDQVGPPPITDLTAAQVPTGNAPGATTGITLTWSTGGAGTVRLYRAPFGAYPLYDANGPVAPPDPALAPGAPWTLAAAAATPGVVDRPATRGFWQYVALVTDSCGATSAVSNRTAGTLDYHLGDVSDGVTAGAGDDRVGTEDVSLLGANYGITEPAIGTRGVAYLDVGPTTDGQASSRPTPDHRLDFEDLMMFATNFRTVSAPAAAAAPAAAEGPPAPTAEAFTVTAPALVEPGTTVSATVRMSGAGRVQGFSARLAWDPEVVEPLGTKPGALVPARGGVVLTPRAGTVDAALLGRRAQGIVGEGEVATVSFRVLRAGDAAIRLAEVRARDAANRALDARVVELRTQAVLPPVTVLLAPAPNPFQSSVALTFSLARPGPAELAVYAVDGRRVRTLVRGAQAAGVYRVLWDGTDDGGRRVAPGLFLARLEAGGAALTRRVAYVR